MFPRHGATRLVLPLFLLLLALAVGSPRSIVAASTQAYIVVLNDSVRSPAATADEIAQQVGGQVGHVYAHALKGFSIDVAPQALAAIQKNPNVKYVETDDPVMLFEQTIPTGIKRIFADTNGNLDIDGSDDWRVDVDVAVIDTGVDYDHPDLNVVGGVNCAQGGPWGGSCSSGGDDDHYHGTHVAGTIAAIDNGSGVVGVAPGARIWTVKVLNSRGSGYESWIVAGIDWVAANASTIEVANMSLGGSGYSQAEYDAIQGAVNAGVAFAVAAGNDDSNASNYSPAAFNNVLTVSALADFNGAPGGGASPTCRSDQDDTLADFSNWGSAVDIAAPGVCILSTYPIEQGSYGTISGTSMASPHVAGALAVLASRNNPSNASDVNSLYSQVVDAGNLNWTDDSGDGIKERLLDMSNVTLFNPIVVAGSGGGGGDDDPPSVSIISPANGSTVSGTVSVTASASDDNGVSQVQFFVDGTSMGTDSNGNDGWSATWNTTTSSNGLHTVEAVATDSAGQTASHSVSVTVDNGGGGTSIALNVTAYKLRGEKYADLSWSGASSTNVDIYRNGSVVATTGNDGAYTDGPLGKGGGSATYKVCEAGTSTCSATISVTW